MPTCTAVIMAFPHEFWGLADWHEAQLIGYITPNSTATSRKVTGTIEPLCSPTHHSPPATCGLSGV
jgi:hypothetical protein